MKVKFLSAIGGSDNSYSAGSEYEVDDDFGRRMVEAGYAEAVRSTQPRDEVSTDERGEKAVRRAPRRK